MYDYHIHSNFSPDSKSSMQSMAAAAVNKGVKEIVFTDHYDPDYAIPGWQDYFDFAGNMKEMEQTREHFKDKLNVLYGLEIGLQHGSTLLKCSNAAKSYDYDFIIGSFHCAEGKELSLGDFYSDRTANESALAFYEYNISTLKDYDDFDIVGHINVVDRYSDTLADFDYYKETFIELLKLIIEKGKGIEVNTSSFRYKMDIGTPTLEMLKLYKELGGEIITVGSDAHRPRSVGDYIPWAYKMLKDLGFKYITRYKKRKPYFEAI